MSDEPQDSEIPEITEIDELYAERYPLGQTFVVTVHSPLQKSQEKLGHWQCDRHVH